MDNDRSCRLYIAQCKVCGAGKIGWSSNPFARMNQHEQRHRMQHIDANRLDRQEPLPAFFTTPGVRLFRLVKQKSIPFSWRHKGELLLSHKAIDLGGIPGGLKAEKHIRERVESLSKDQLKGKGKTAEWFLPGFPAEQLAEWLGDVDSRQLWLF